MCSDLYQVNEDVVKKYVETIKRLGKELDSAEDIRLQDVLALPGAIKVDDNIVTGRAKVLPIALETMEKALAGMVELRAREGRTLHEELQSRCENLEQLMG